MHKEKHLDFRKEDVVCDTFFALVGAIYVDQVPNGNFLFLLLVLIRKLTDTSRTLICCPFINKHDCVTVRLLPNGRTVTEASMICLQVTTISNKELVGAPKTYDAYMYANFQ